MLPPRRPLEPEAGDGVREDGLLHEVGPDRHRRPRRAQPGARAVVEADPHAREQLGRVADEPRVAKVVGGAGLAGEVAVKPSARESTLPCRARLRPRAARGHEVRLRAADRRRSGGGDGHGAPSASTRRVRRSASKRRPPLANGSTRARARAASPRRRRAPGPERRELARDAEAAGRGRTTAVEADVLGDADGRGVERALERASDVTRPSKRSS